MNEQDLESVAGGFKLGNVWSGLKFELKPYSRGPMGMVWDRTLGRSLGWAALIALGYGLAKRKEIYNWLMSKFESNKVETKK